ncbi:MAG TPA: DNA alkylation repair protein [Saprospiraceae bacterium]|nr:DNA alkylation repair protein [Saprospiraceae bacterium]HPN70324.1 DNA alkylation repair protein [Saprospiraceae bacterium]
MKTAASLILVLEQNVNVSYAVQMKAYMKGHFEFFGIKSELRKEILKNNFDKKAVPLGIDLQKILDELWACPQREAQYCAIDITDKYLKSMDISWLPYFENKITSKSWWDTVDHLAAHQIGHLLSTQNKDFIRNKCEEWIDSNNLWLQRTSIIFQIFYKKQTDFELMSDNILATLEVKDFFIRKAHGWALRQYSKTNKVAVAEFIRNHREVLSPLAIKEGSKYL